MRSGERNLKKTGDMAVGQVSFKKESNKHIKRVHVPARDNAIVNRLLKTKRTVEVDHEAELVARQKADSLARKQAAETMRNQQKELDAQRKREKEERSYDRLFSEEALRESKSSQAKDDDDDFFMVCCFRHSAKSSNTVMLSDP